MYVPSIFYKVYEKTLRRQLFAAKRPHHMGLIVDGNRRFAMAQKLATRKAGHMAGSDNLEGFLRWCLELEIKMVTLYGFSTENYNRSGEEVEELMSIILNKFRTLKTDPLIADENVEAVYCPMANQLSQEMNKEIDSVEAQTAENDGFQLNIAIGYGGRAEIVDAVKKIGERIKIGEIDIDDIDEQLLSNHLYTEGMPDPDLIIRTSGEERLSGFLLWHSAY